MYIGNYPIVLSDEALNRFADYGIDTYEDILGLLRGEFERIPLESYGVLFQTNQGAIRDLVYVATTLRTYGNSIVIYTMEEHYKIDTTKFFYIGCLVDGEDSDSGLEVELTFLELMQYISREEEIER